VRLRLAVIVVDLRPRRAIEVASAIASAQLSGSHRQL
jgi:hypothetical protein